ncbi:MAG: c-type cytochrome [Rhodanobacter sp.]
MRHRLQLTATFALAALSMSAGNSRAQEVRDVPAIATQLCESCHGPNGNSINPTVPSIAGQVEPYLYKQLHAFQSQTRVGVMSGVAMGLSDADARALAAYFSRQHAHWNPQPSRVPRQSRQGRIIYVDGIADKHVPACASCHALDGSGLPPEFPRLAGQHANYIATQLRAFRSSSRMSNPNAMMRVVSAPLTDAQINAVSQYITDLR